MAEFGDIIIQVWLIICLLLGFGNQWTYDHSYIATRHGANMTLCFRLLQAEPTKHPFDGIYTSPLVCGSASNSFLRISKSRTYACTDPVFEGLNHGLIKRKRTLQSHEQTSLDRSFVSWLNHERWVITILPFSHIGTTLQTFIHIHHHRIPSRFRPHISYILETLHHSLSNTMYVPIWYR